MTHTLRALLASVLLMVGTTASAIPILVINDGVGGHPMVINAINYLNSLGHTVSTGGTLADYSAFGQVWDLRYNANLGAADVAAMGSYLQGGGRMYMTGEWSAFDGVRNTSLVAFLNSVGAGALTLEGTSFFGSQNLTAAAQAVGLDNDPNAFASVVFTAAQQVLAMNAGSGFTATEAADGSGGSLIGWDFGDIAGAAGARLLVGFDIEIFAATNGVLWAENMQTYLGAADVSVPEPGTLALLGLGLVGMAFAKRRKKA